MARKRRIAVVGLGMALKPHLQSLMELADRVEIAACYAPSEARRQAFAAAHRHPLAADLESILGDPTIDAVLLLTPPSSHLELVERAAAAGKHVLLEKPVEVTVARAERLVGAMERAGLRLGVVLQHRFRAVSRRLGSLVAAGELGRLVSGSAAVRWWRPPEYFAAGGRGSKARDGGGVLLTQAIHTLDLFLSLAGPISQVAAFAATSPLRKIDTEDVVGAAIRFADGAIGTIDATTVAFPGFPERIELACEKGTAVLAAETLERLFQGRPAPPRVERAVRERRRRSHGLRQRRAQGAHRRLPRRPRRGQATGGPWPRGAQGAAPDRGDPRLVGGGPPHGDSMSMARIFLTHVPDMLANYYGPRALAALKALGEVRVNESGRVLDAAALAEAARGCEIVVSDRQTQGPAAFFAAAPDVVAFLRVAVDIRNIDVAAASAAGVLVTHATPGFVASVAEMAVGFMVDLARHVSDSVLVYRQGAVPGARTGRQLKGSVLGIIGYGVIGQYLAALGKALGMTVVVADPYKKVADPALRQASLEDLLAAADFVVCLAVATEETENLMDAAAFAHMRGSAYFINLSRGNLVDEAALERALAEKRIAGAALDVGRAHDQMPSLDLARRPDVIATPHAAGLTPEAIEHQAFDTVAQVAELVAGRLPPGAVNAEAATRLKRLRA